jgi:C4-dicarboxylate transporter, DctQ subunit
VSRSLERTADFAAVLAGSIAGVMMLVNAVLITIEVIARNLGHPTAWILDTTVYLTIWSVYVGISYVEASNAQVRMGLLSDAIGSTGKTVLTWFTSIVSAVFLLLLIYWSARQAAVSYSTARTTMSLLRFPIYLLELAVPVGGVLVLFQLIVSRLRPERGEQRPDSLAGAE